MRKLLSLSVSMLAMAALAGCTVGPDYKGPQGAAAVPPPASFARAGETTAQAPQLAKWWTALGDPVLDGLEAKALAANPNLGAALARVQQARAGLRLDKTNDLPKVGAMGAGLIADLPGNQLGGSLSYYNAALDAQWEIDLFGGQRRKVEASVANAQAAEAKLADAQVSLTAEVAQTYINLRDRQQRLALGQQMLEVSQQALALTKARLAQGVGTQSDAERSTRAVEDAAAALLPLQAERDAYLNALAVLLGEAPGALDASLAALKPIPLPPAELAVGDPASLIQRRPDLRAAERQLAASTAKIGVADAARFPKLKLTGFLGLGGSKLEDIFDPSSMALLAAPQLSWNFLDFGGNSARLAQAKAARDEASEQYRGAVLQALRDAEDSLARYGAARAQAASKGRSAASATQSAQLAGQRFAAGTISRLALLDAERERLTAQQASVQAVASMSAQYVTLQKSLGLGWD
jgi:NodT family efflux transporter outer membrane factor (OMF) lipoprotein